MKTLSIIVAAFASSFLCAQQSAQPAAQTPQPEGAVASKLGLISGVVVNAKTGEPLRRVNLTVRSMNTVPGAGQMGAMTAPSAPYAATTDAEGKFRIENVEPGTYRMTAERQGFVRQEYGARQISSVGSAITVAAGQSLTDINFKLTPQAVLVGRVIDEEGEPLARVQIQVLRQRFFQGKQQLVPSGGGQTLDTGEYRVADLPPGRYWVSATYRIGRMMEGPPRASGDKPEEEYVQTFYPDALDQASARYVEVQAGQEVPGIDIRIRKTRVFRIRGKVTGGAAPLRTMRILLLPREPGAMMSFAGNFGSLVNEDGAFEIAGVQPGSYWVAVPPMGGPQSLIGKVPVDVQQRNVENVILALSQPASLSGTVQIQGDLQKLEASSRTKLALGSVRVHLMPVDSLPMIIPPNAMVKDDGSFRLESVGPGRYRVSVFNVPRGTWLKSVRVGDQDVLDTGLDMSGGAPASLQVILATGTGQLSGTAQNAKQQAAPGSIVTLVPSPMKEGRNDLYRMTTADQNGLFTLQGLPPGDYKLFAWEDVDLGAYTNAEFLKPHESKALKITVKPDGSEQVSIQQIPAEAVVAAQ